MDVFGKDEATEYSADSISNIFSSGKTVAAILMAIMQDQGRLKYHDEVSKHWPEFG